MTALAPVRRGLGAVVLVAAVGLVSQVGAAAAAGLVTGREIEDGSIARADVRNGSLTGADVADGSLAPRDVGEDLRGETGPEGPQGPAGSPGEPGLPGVRGVVMVSASGLVAAPGSYRGGQAVCPPGTKVLGGGYHATAPDGTVEIIQTAPMNDGRGWITSYRNTGSVDVTGQVWAICAQVA